MIGGGGPCPKAIVCYMGHSKSYIFVSSGMGQMKLLLQNRVTNFCITALAAVATKPFTALWPHDGAKALPSVRTTNSLVKEFFCQLGQSKLWSCFVVLVFCLFY